VMFTFGLFMNSTGVSRTAFLPVPYPQPEVGFQTPKDIVPYTPNRGVTHSISRNLFEVDDEEEGGAAKIKYNYNNNIYNDKETTNEGIEKENVKNKQVVPVQPRQLINPLRVEPAGIYSVSYSPDPAIILADAPSVKIEDNGENSTYMLFLDPRPDLVDNDGEINTPPSTDLTKASDLQVSTYTHTKHVIDRKGLPPMIISLVVPNHMANGSNPLFPKDSSSDSLVEITCQVVDISITTSERTTQTAN